MSRSGAQPSRQRLRSRGARRGAPGLDAERGDAIPCRKLISPALSPRRASEGLEPGSVASSERLDELHKAVTEFALGGVVALSSEADPALAIDHHQSGQTGESEGGVGGPVVVIGELELESAIFDEGPNRLRCVAARIVGDDEDLDVVAMLELPANLLELR